MKAENVVLVHSGFVDGSGWEGVYKIPEKTKRELVEFHRLKKETNHEKREV